jgi:sporulation protein YlmC with PRC-barrel domain
MGEADREGAGILMRLSELLGREVVSESGLRLGHVHEVRGELVEGHLRVTGLVAGKLGILERYGMGTQGSGGPTRAKVRGHPAIPWERVVRVGPKVILRD